MYIKIELIELSSKKGFIKNFSLAKDMYSNVFARVSSLLFAFLLFVETFDMVYKI